VREARFDLIWLPPPSFAGANSAGYNPKEYFNLNNSYGNFDAHRAMLVTLRIPIQSGRVFRHEAGQCSGMKPATIPR
jgi:hypothetical protein